MAVEFTVLLRAYWNGGVIFSKYAEYIFHLPVTFDINHYVNLHLGLDGWRLDNQVPPYAPLVAEEFLNEIEV